ncbi:hypothetical protein [Myroides sp. N17-2]|uniref:hypothetical protein n=1 Tax=Myroides sp. N17-2 TaxID=2030799 RepID=UPI000EFA8796|nr:hypothetical protein [Myroides sp. N17-2]
METTIILNSLLALGRCPNQDLDVDNTDVMDIVRRYTNLLDKLTESISLKSAYSLLDIIPLDKFYNVQWEIFSKIKPSP